MIFVSHAKKKKNKLRQLLRSLFCRAIENNLLIILSHVHLGGLYTASLVTWLFAFFYKSSYFRRGKIVACNI